MTIPEFLETIDVSPPAPVYLFCSGKVRNKPSFEPVLAERAVAHVVAKYVDPSMKDFCYGVYYADETKAARVVDEARLAPFLGERRVIVVRNAERYESREANEALLAYLDSPSPTTVLLLMANQIDRRLSLYKACAKAGEVVECPALTEENAKKEAQAAIRARGKRITSSAAAKLIERVGVRLGDIENAVEILCNYVGDRPKIEEADIAACPETGEAIIWALTDALALSDTTAALRVLHEILEPNKNEFLILGSINWMLETAYSAVLREDAPRKLSAFQTSKVTPLAKKLGREGLRQAFFLCLETDLLMRSTGVDRRLALELLIVKLAALEPSAKSR